MNEIILEIFAFISALLSINYHIFTNSPSDIQLRNDVWYQKTQQQPTSNPPIPTPTLKPLPHQYTPNTAQAGRKINLMDRWSGQKDRCSSDFQTEVLEIKKKT